MIKMKIAFQKEHLIFLIIIVWKLILIRPFGIVYTSVNLFEVGLFWGRIFVSFIQAPYTRLGFL